MDWPGIIAIVTVVLDYVIKFLAIGIVPENRRPSSSTGWLLLILFLPGLGILVYLLIGSPYVHGRRREVQDRANRELAAALQDQPTVPAGSDLMPALDTVVALNRRLTSFPMVTGAVQRLVGDAREAVAQLADAADAAEFEIHVEMYIAAWDDVTDPFFQALSRAVKRGVKVRFLFDHWGSRKYQGFKQFKQRLTAAGIEWRMMMPLLPLKGHFRRPDLRNHRKLVVFDRKLGFLGSRNLIDPSYLSKANIRSGREWIDLNVWVTGDIVRQLSTVFQLDWYQETNKVLDTAGTELEPEAGSPTGSPMQLVPSGPGFTTEPNLRLFVSLVALAEHKLEVVSPYFVPDESLLNLLTTAALRGVEVELFVSAKADQFMVHHAQRSYYGTLLEAGIRIWMYPEPMILHSKYLVVDSEIGVIGSSNMDMRSFFLDYEVSLMSVDADFVSQLKVVSQQYRDRSTELTPELWSKQPLAQRYLDNVMRLTSALQ